MNTEAVARLQLLTSLNTQVSNWVMESVTTIFTELRTKELPPAKQREYSGMLEGLNMFFSQWHEIMVKERSAILHDE